jgi:hypothetical protein
MKTKTQSTRALLIAQGVIRESTDSGVIRTPTTHKASTAAAIAARRHELARDIPQANANGRGARK